jgi:pimeloyl-ACP methyl ester carboxylesterase
MTTSSAAVDDPRRDLLAELPLTERRMELAGVSTAVLEGGAGGDAPNLVLLHGPAEFAAAWARVVPELVATHRLVVPDLPGHGASTVTGSLSSDQVIAWLGELLAATCAAPPTVVGRVIGGAIAARFASRHRDAVNRLVLVDTLGLTELRPMARFELVMNRFFAQPTEHSYDRLMAECLYDVDRVRDELGELWTPYEAYALDRARTPSVQAATGALIGLFGAASIPPAELKKISAPVALIWGRHDLVTPLAVAEAASADYGWPLQVIEDAGDEPTLDQPQAFMSALRRALDDGR